jgi:trehalose 6-phosphate phosphatase
VVLPAIDDIACCAIFLDLDGTIVELVEHPDAVRVEASTLQLLGRLHEKSGSALAVISGREIALIDLLLRPLVLPAAGVHGLQRRDAAGTVYVQKTPGIRRVALTLRKVIGEEAGVVIEQKPGAVALHYRLRPELERRCCEIVEEIARRRPDLRIVHGKMVFEILAKGADKGSVIKAFLSEPPFLGRKPIFAGDDVTDESGFSAVNALGGLSIKVGATNTSAHFAARDVDELRDWLCKLAGETLQELSDERT